MCTWFLACLCVKGALLGSAEAALSPNCSCAMSACACVGLCAAMVLPTTGVVTVEAPAGTRPAVLKLEKIDDAEAALQPGYKGTTDYIDSVTVSCTG